MLKSKDVDAYIEKFEADEQVIIQNLREVIFKSIDPRFEERLNYGMMGYVVPFSLYPQGYHVDPRYPLPFLGLAKQKHHYAFYTMGLSAFEDRFEDFKTYYEVNYGRLDHGVGCLRFRNPKKIPYEALSKLIQNVSVEAYIQSYETVLKESRKK